MKKIISIGIMLMMSLALLTGCGADLTPAKEKLSEIETVFTEATELYEANGWNQDETMVQTHDDIEKALAEMKEALDSPGLVTDDDVEQILGYLDIIMEQVNMYKEAVGVSLSDVASEVISEAISEGITETTEAENPLDLTVFTEKYNEIFELHKKVADQAQQNGWVEDEDVVNALREGMTLMETPRSIIENVTALDGQSYTQADIDEMTANLVGYIETLNELQTKTATAK